MDELKSMKGAQYHGYEGAPNRDIAVSIFNEDKLWSVEDCTRNRFQLEYLQGGNPYAPWEKPLIDLTFERPLRDHQKEMVAQVLTYHYVILACEMGTGKTLAAIEVMERSGFDDWWYVAPRSALKSVELELLNWDCKIKPKLMTYNGLVKEMKNWPEGQYAPHGIVVDESQKVKTPTALRSQATQAIADGIRQDHGWDGFVIEMSGSPAPKAPTDWHNQCEIAYPGFIKEGTLNKFKFRLAIHEKKDSFAGGTYHERVTWLDDELKCSICGEYKENQIHSNVNPDLENHEWQPSVNEVHKLYRRMKGLVLVKLKKDCLDLPDKQYKIITAPMLPSTLRAAKMIAGKGGSAAQILTLLRELSDGFQYKEVEDGVTECSCITGTIADFQIKPEWSEYYEEHGTPPEDPNLSSEEYREKYYDAVQVMCHSCGGTKQVNKYKRITERVPCPKDDVFKELLDQHSDIGRLVVYAGFTGSVERCVEVALSQEWAVVKWDGQGVKVYNHKGTPLRTLANPPSKTIAMDAEGAVHPLVAFQHDFENFPRMCFIGNAGAAGTGLTLTASPSIFYYSNSFNAEDRIQSEDRIHRIGMDENRGATIIDVQHLPTDAFIRENLTKKRKLQDLTLGEINSIFEQENGYMF